MWTYEKRLQYPVNIKNPNPKAAKFIISQLGGPDGELAASLRYLNQRFSMPYSQLKGLLTDIGTEELAHQTYIYIKAAPRSKNLPGAALLIYRFYSSIHLLPCSRSSAPLREEYP